MDESKGDNAPHEALISFVTGIGPAKTAVAMDSSKMTQELEWGPCRDI
jgi:hypothetical protein